MSTPFVQVGPYTFNIAAITIKSTYVLDLETARALEDMARRWKVSKSEALRRAIRAAEHNPAPGAPAALEALDTLQNSLNLDSHTATRWEKRVRAERLASSVRRESK